MLIWTLNMIGSFTITWPQTKPATTAQDYRLSYLLLCNISSRRRKDYHKLYFTRKMLFIRTCEIVPIWLVIIAIMYIKKYLIFVICTAGLFSEKKDQFWSRNTKIYKICKGFIFPNYNISQRKFGILLILGCCFKLWWYFCLDQNFVYYAMGPLTRQLQSGAWKEAGKTNLGASISNVNVQFLTTFCALSIENCMWI